MCDENEGYNGSETTGFQSPAQDYIETVPDLARLLDLRKPGTYAVRVAGAAYIERGIHDGNILVVNKGGRPTHGKVAVAILQGSLRLATLERRVDGWFLNPPAPKKPCQSVKTPAFGQLSPASSARPSDADLRTVRCEQLLLFM